MSSTPQQDRDDNSVRTSDSTGALDERAPDDPSDTAHAVGEKQAAENVENEPTG